MILLTHPTGNQNVRQALMAFDEAGMLSGFRTCISWNECSALNGLFPRTLRNELARRSFPAGLRDKTRTFPLREAGRLFISKFGAKNLTTPIRGFFSVDQVYRSFDRFVSREINKGFDVDSVYCYEDGALETFKAAKQNGIKCIYELPIGYWRAGQEIFREEMALNPEWGSTLKGINDTEEKLQSKDEELSIADTVIVPSLFVSRTLAMFPGKKILPKVIHYGAPAPVEKKLRSSRGALKVLFVGILTQRKGLSYLLDAVSKLGSDVELTLIGRRQDSDSKCVPLSRALGLHRWVESMPHGKVLEEMSTHDVLVFPSLFEGFGLVILEAMSRGLPVITTAHTAGPDLIMEGENGFIVPVRSSEAIAEKLNTLNKDRNMLTHMGMCALERARSCTWEIYRENLKNAVQDDA